MRLSKALDKTLNIDSSYTIALIITCCLLFIMLNNRSWDNGYNDTDIISPENIPLGTNAHLEIPPDFDSFVVVSEKKQAFFNYLRPIIRQENLNIKYDRALLEKIKENLTKDKQHVNATMRKLRRLANKYDLKLINTQKTIDKLELRIGTIPESLVLVQAAIESAWGTSRFAKEANNYFGQWCYSKGCGLVPSERLSDASHEVRRFDSVKDSVISYMKNLNTYYAYKQFRRTRNELIQNGKAMKGSSLALALTSYSERGEDYINDLLVMIEQNDLE